MEHDPGRIVIAGIQMDPRLGDRAANLESMESRARQAAARGARLVIFPECCLTGYVFEDAREAMAQAEPVPGPATDAMARLCRELGVHTVFGMLERDGGRLYNSLALVGPDGPVGESYRKAHLPRLGVDRFAAPGDRPLRVHATPLGRLGLHICYDGGFPETARVLTLLGADLIALPTNWPPGAEALAEHSPIVRAIENHVWFIAVNRVGEERGFRFIGRSSIVDPLGRVLAAAGPDAEEVIVAEIEPARARAKEIVRFGGAYRVDRIADRRPELYGPITTPAIRRDESR